MHRQLKHEGRRAPNLHIAAKGLAICHKFGPRIGWNTLNQVLLDRSVVRYPCRVVFDASLLEQDELAFTCSHTENPEDGFTIYVHPYFRHQLDRAVIAVFSQLVIVNYGDFLSFEEAETFAANALGLSADDLYYKLCEMADEIA